MEGEIVIKRWEDLDGEVSSYRLCCLLSFHFNIILLKLSRHLRHQGFSVRINPLSREIIPLRSHLEGVKGGLPPLLRPQGEERKKKSRENLQLQLGNWVFSPAASHAAGDSLFLVFSASRRLRREARYQAGNPFTGGARSPLGPPACKWEEN